MLNYKTYLEKTKLQEEKIQVHKLFLGFIVLYSLSESDNKYWHSSDSKSISPLVFIL